jgi:outer membrane protein assembly factor BamD
MRNKFCLIIVLAAALVGGCSSFKKEEIDENATVEELYERAQVSLQKGNWDAAVERLRTLEARYPYGVYAEQAQLDTIYAYYRNNEPGLAIAAADRFIKLHPAHSSVDYAYYLKGVSSFEEDKSSLGVITGKDDLSDRDPTLTLNAMNAFRDVYTLFPESRYAPSARERVRYLSNTLAKHQIAVATYYYSKEAYVAVVNRAKGVVEDYPNTPAVEEALALLYRSYEAMGLGELADDSRRVLELNFPNSVYLSGNTKFTGQWYSGSAKQKEDKDGFFSSIRNFFKKEPAG